MPRTQVAQRYRTVLRVFARHGFGYMVSQLGLARLIPWRRSPKNDDIPGRGERLRQALVELGPAFIKVGQMLAGRSDLLPADIVSSLERLQDQVEPFPFAQVEQIVSAELGRHLDRCYASFEPVPLAAASLGQVHAAVLLDGRPAAVKVQRPGVVAQIELDLHVLEGLARLATRRTTWGRNYDLLGVVREFGAMLRAELDYRQEGANADRFRENFQDDPMVQFPQVFWDYTTERVLTMERMEGLRITDRKAMLARGIRPSAVAERLAGAIFRMVLRDGFFHADPHPGNLFVGPTGAIIFVDMGMVGELTKPMRDNVVDYVVGVVTGDSDRVVQAIMRMGLVNGTGLRLSLRQEVERLQRKYGDVPIRQVEFGPALREIMALARRFYIRFPSSYAVLLKSMTTLESVARQVDPEATLIGLAAPYAEQLMAGQLKPERLLGRFGREVIGFGRSALRIPGQVSRVLGLMEDGEWKLTIDHSGLDPTLRRLSAIANRLAIAILLASLIIGTALVSSRSPQSVLGRYPIADVGFILIGALGVWLVLSILRR